MSIPRLQRKDEPKYFEVPPIEVASFIGRKALLEEVHATLRENADWQKSLVLYGLGGAGKTAKTTNQAGGIWRSFGLTLLLQQQRTRVSFHCHGKFSRKIATEAQKSESAGESIEHIKSLLRDRTTPWLIVFDNLDSPDSFRQRQLNCIDTSLLKRTERS